MASGVPILKHFGVCPGDSKVYEYTFLFFCHFHTGRQLLLLYVGFSAQAFDAWVVFFTDCLSVWGYQVGPYKDLCLNHQLNTSYRK